MIQIENVSFEYFNHLALKQVNITIPKGSITALVGPNGAGKTTLMRCIAALSSPKEGIIKMDGINVIENPHECHRMTGYLADNFGLYDKLTVYQSLLYFAQAHGIEHAEVRVHEVIQLINLEDKTNEMVQNLSRGMRQRVGIGQSIIHKPAYLILDEPASGLDPEARIQLSALFIRLNQQGTTLLVSSHILAELDQYANNLLIIKDGQVLEQNIMKNEQNPYQTLVITATNTITIDHMPAEFRSHFEQIDNHKVLIRVPKDFEKSLLLKHLIAQNIEVDEVYVETKNLQDTYLETIRNR